MASASQAATRALTEQRSLSVGGVERTYRVYVPTALDPASPAPLLLWLHGAPGTSEGAEQRTGLNDQADQFRFIVAYPQGLPAANSWWNTGQCCGAGEDVAFILQIIDVLAKEYRLDAARVYVAGSSAGGMMAYRLACEAADRLAAVASISGAVTVADCRPARPVSILALHGTVDEQVPYDGGVVRGVVPSINIKSVVQTNADWRALNGCPPPTVEKSGAVTRTTASPCRSGTEVTLYTVRDGQHIAPITAAIGGTFASSDIPLVVKFLLAQKRSAAP